MSTQSKRLRVGLAITAATIGAGLGGAAIAGAATTATSSPSTATGGTSAATQTAPDPATITHGPGETLLTDTTADKVKTAALAAVPGGTIIRVETDSGGSPYEAHVTKTDGTQMTVKVDASFKVTQPSRGSAPDRVGDPAVRPPE